MNAISNNAHRPVDVDPQPAAIALDRLDPLRPFRDGLTALGLDHRVAIRPIHTKAGASTRSVPSASLGHCQAAAGPSSLGQRLSTPPPTTARFCRVPSKPAPTTPTVASDCSPPGPRSVPCSSRSRRACSDPSPSSPTCWQTAPSHGKYPAPSPHDTNRERVRLGLRPAPCGLDYGRLVPHVRGRPLAVTRPLARRRSLTT
jgi:hypothetical protein